jgi:hypothetical protein
MNLKTSITSHENLESLAVEAQENQNFDASAPHVMQGNRTINSPPFEGN